MVEFTASGAKLIPLGKMYLDMGTWEVPSSLLSQAARCRGMVLTFLVDM